MTILNSKATHHRDTEDTDIFLFFYAGGAENLLNVFSVPSVPLWLKAFKPT